VIDLLAAVALSSPLVAFAVTQFVSLASPGPIFFVLTDLARTARHTALVAAYGVCISEVVWSAGAVIGLAGFFEAFPAALATARYTGAAYMLWLGLRLVRNGLGRPQPNLGEASAGRRAEVSTAGAVRRGFLVGIANPTTLAYYLSVFTLVMPHDISPLTAATVVVLAVAISAIWWGAVAVLFSWELVRQRASRMQRPLDVLAGGVFLAFGVQFLAT